MMIKNFTAWFRANLGKSLRCSRKRLGQKVITVDSYDNAPAMQVVDLREIVNMFDGDELDRIVEKHKPGHYRAGD